MGPLRFTALCYGMLATTLAPIATAQSQRTATRALPITPLAHLSTIQVQMNGTGPYTFVIDTGAGITVINQELASKLDLPIVGKMQIGSPMGTVPIDADSLSIATLRIGDVVVKDAAAVAMNLHDIFAPLEAPDGILAAASIEGHLMTINFPEGYVLVQPGALPTADGGRIMDYDGRGVVPTVSISVAGEAVMAALDCGAPAGFSLPSRYADTLPLASAPTVTAHGRTVDADFEIRSSELVGVVEMGAIRLTNPTIAFNDRAEIAHIGMSILGDFSITIDRTNQRIAFDKPSKAKVTSGQPRRVVRGTSGGPSYGIRLGGLSGDVLSVLGTEAGLPAATAGLQSGDQIVAMNGTPVKSLDNEERIAALRGSPLVLLLNRDGKELELTLSHNK